MPFVKNDPRINRKGRPPGFGVRRRLKELGEEKAEHNGVMMAKSEIILQKVIEGAMDGDIQDRRLYMEYMYGKPTQPVEVDGDVCLAPYTEENRKMALKLLGITEDDSNE